MSKLKQKKTEFSINNLTWVGTDTFIWTKKFQKSRCPYRRPGLQSAIARCSCLACLGNIISNFWRSRTQEVTIFTSFIFLIYICIYVCFFILLSISFIFLPMLCNFFNPPNFQDLNLGIIFIL